MTASKDLLVRDKILRYTSDIRTAYEDSSVVPHVAEEAVRRQEQEPEGFLESGVKYALSMHDFESRSHEFLLSNIGNGIANSEVRQITDSISNTRGVEVLEEFLTLDLLESTISSYLIEHGHPTIVFVPRRYFKDFYKWQSKRLSPFDPRLDGRSITVSNQTIHLSWSNKYREFDRVIITSKSNNRWKYRPAHELNKKNTGISRRLTVTFDTESDYTQVILVAKSVYKFEIDKPSQTLVIYQKEKESMGDCLARSLK